MPRQKRTDPATARNVTLPDTLWQKIDQLDFDPTKQKPRYGHLNRLFERLVRAELKRIEGVRAIATENQTGDI